MGTDLPNKAIVILGPTASGKSSLGIKLAKKFNGEIISADSRQVYRGMDLGSGKVTKLERRMARHHLLDVASPKKQFTVAQFIDLAKKAIKKITNKGKLPIIVGGSPFYIYSLIDGIILPNVKPDTQLRARLAKKSLAQLCAMLKKLDPKRYKKIDKKNPVRLIRAIEINLASGKSVPQNLHNPSSKFLLIGIKKNPKELRGLINKRVGDRLKMGMAKEVQKLKNIGLSFKRLESFGLEYRFIALFLQGKLTKEEMIKQLKTAIWQFSKRQMTWFKKDERIRWVNGFGQAETIVKKYLKTEF